MDLIRIGEICAAAMAAFMVLSCGCSRTPARPQAPRGAMETKSDGRQRMTLELRRLAQRTDVENMYLGEGRLAHLRNQLALAKRTQNASQVEPTMVALGKEALKLGHLDEAIQNLQAVYDGFSQSPPTGKIPVQAQAELLYDLATAYLRSGEVENCVHCRTGESCILPIQGAGVHAQKSGSKSAVRYLLKLLELPLEENHPKRTSAIWLLNIAGMTLGEYPANIPEKYLIPPERFQSQEKFPRFENIAAALKLDTNTLLGSVIADDFDGDHQLDLVVSNWDTNGQLLYFHNNGNGTFADRTQQANLTGILGGINLIQADYDNDGDTDVFVLRGAWLAKNGRHPNSLLRNDGRAKFTDVTFESGLGKVHYPTQTAGWADYDNDGDLDLYVGNEDFPGQLFENDGKGHFQDVASRAKVTNNRMAKAVAWGDFDGDRFPDLFVSNYQGGNRLYRNQRDGTFRDVAPDAGVTKPLKSFPAWFWDYDNDGALDLYVSSYQMGVEFVAAHYLHLPYEGPRNCLYKGDGRGGFQEVAAQTQITQVSQPMGSNFGDLDNDGFLDFYLGTGYPDYDALMPNLMYRNVGGSNFHDVTFAGGFGHLQKGHGVAFADFDHDGDQDVFMEIGGAYKGDAFPNALFENPGFGNHWLKIRLMGQQSNRSAIGARIHLVVEEDGKERSIYRWVNSGGSFGANPLRQEIGLGASHLVKRLEVYWPTTDNTQVFVDVAANQFIEIQEGDSQFKTIPLRAMKFAAQ